MWLLENSNSYYRDDFFWQWRLNPQWLLLIMAVLKFSCTMPALIWSCGYSTLNEGVNSPGTLATCRKSKMMPCSLGLMLKWWMMKMTIFDQKLFNAVNVTVTCLKLNIMGLQTFHKPAGILKENHQKVLRR
jgi:hypothetical protein